jgi:hypothetical protein
MLDSPLNGAEQALQPSFRKSLIFNGLLMAVAVGLAYLPIRALPDRRPMADASDPLSYRPVQLAPVGGPLRLVGAWVLEANDRRFGGLSALAIDDGKFLAVSDRGSVVRFSLPGSVQPRVELTDLRDGPGPFGKKMTRDAESLARDPQGRGWWVGFEQQHSLWLFGKYFRRSLASAHLEGMGWRNNRGAEGLIVRDGQLLALGENGRDAVRIYSGKIVRLKLQADAELADAATAPDGNGWVLLRKKGLGGISQSIAPLEQAHGGYRVGTAWPVPKGPFDNLEGMAIERLANGTWRFWLISDDGHRVMARTLLVALDLELAVRHDKGPATGVGPLKKSKIDTP